MSTAVLVLVVVTVPLALGQTDPAPGVEKELERLGGEADSAQDQAQEDAERARAQAEQQAQEAQEYAGGVSTGAERDLKQTGHDAENLALVVVDFGLTVVNNVGDWLVKTSDDVLTLVSPITSQFFGGPKPGQEGGFTAQSSDYSIARPDVMAPLFWVAASAGLGVIAFLVLRRLVAIGAIPLLSRIAHSEIYNNDARRTISELVVGEPGQCLNDLVGRTGYSRNAVSYHLFVLEKEEEIVSVKDGKYRRYFARNGKYVNGAKNVVAALRNQTTLKLAQAVQAKPGSIQRDLCVELGATPSATCWHAKRLLELGVIRKERAANTVKYYPGDALAKYDLSDMGLARMTPSPAPASGLAPTPL